MELNVGDIGEKELVDYILSKCGSITPDDGAVTSLSDGMKLVSTCDMLIQSKHFPEDMTYFQMGFKAVTVNVSDIAAMGAEPLGFLLSMAVPKSLKLKDFKEIFEGVLEACRVYEIPLIGGDTNEADEIIMAGTALGLAEEPMMKNSYGKGDLIGITGDIGLAALGFYSKSPKYIDHILMPIARLNESRILRQGGATSVTDITDGLASELHEMFNGRGILIYEDSLGITDEFKRISNDCGFGHLDLILEFGEDFELVFTIPKDKVNQLRDRLDFRIIGEVTDSSKIEIKLSSGETREILKKGYNHFK